eukprot:CAMPEP_0119191658 /NCGR_PEP_ID=MMETSP1316-20130426/2392_1 /TAXON_ID=41880 /ORGANISM="Pycnococcus provasolii, Strain RCC2336" /LENGTH=924 /DNA_ID=CAMNT_0007186715 /DNA_START=227 /DNA_END=3001 /DNA_ORIENTATION=+
MSSSMSSLRFVLLSLFVVTTTTVLCVGENAQAAEVPSARAAAVNSNYGAPGKFGVGTRRVRIPRALMPRAYHDTLTGATPDDVPEAQVPADFEVDVIYPSDVVAVEPNLPISTKGPFAAVAWAPGWTCLSEQYTSVTHHLASHGFVVVSAVSFHGVAVPSFLQDWQDMLLALEWIRLFDSRTHHEDNDVVRAIQAEHAHWLANAIDRDQLGLAGHSSGGSTVLRAAAGDGRRMKRRVKAVMTMSPSEAVMSDGRSVQQQLDAAQDDDPTNDRKPGDGWAKIRAEIRAPVSILAGELDRKTPMGGHSDIFFHQGGGSFPRTYAVIKRGSHCFLEYGGTADGGGGGGGVGGVKNHTWFYPGGDSECPEAKLFTGMLDPRKQLMITRKFAAQFFAFQLRGEVATVGKTWGQELKNDPDMLMAMTEPLMRVTVDEIVESERGVTESSLEEDGASVNTVTLHPGVDFVDIRGRVVNERDVYQRGEELAGMWEREETRRRERQNQTATNTGLSWDMLESGPPFNTFDGGFLNNALNQDERRMRRNERRMRVQEMLGRMDCTDVADDSGSSRRVCVSSAGTSAPTAMMSSLQREREAAEAASASIAANKPTADTIEPVVPNYESEHDSATRWLGNTPADTYQLEDVDSFEIRVDASSGLDVEVLAPTLVPTAPGSGAPYRLRVRRKRRTQGNVPEWLTIYSVSRREGAKAAAVRVLRVVKGLDTPSSSGSWGAVTSDSMGGDGTCSWGEWSPCNAQVSVDGFIDEVGIESTAQLQTKPPRKLHCFSGEMGLMTRVRGYECTAPVARVETAQCCVETGARSRTADDWSLMSPDALRAVAQLRWVKILERLDFNDEDSRTATVHTPMSAAKPATATFERPAVALLVAQLRDALFTDRGRSQIVEHLARAGNNEVNTSLIRDAERAALFKSLGK